MKRIIIVLFFVFAFVDVYSQSKSEIIDNQISILQQKLVLNEKQVISIKGYFANAIKELSTQSSAQETKSLIQEKILNNLDPRQKSKYLIIQQDWWKDLFDELSQ